MSAYLVFSLVFVLLLLQAFRVRNWRERLLFLSLFLLTLLVLGMHPWVSHAYTGLIFLEKGALLALVAWLVGNPLALWLEKRRREKKAFFLLQNGKGALAEIVTAARMLSERKRGGLIAIERKDPLDTWIQSGIPLDAKIRRETISSVFTPPGALHDGGMIIQGDRIAACGVVFPLSKRLDLPTELGTRHRAGLGLSEVSDALVMIISEETGKISFADRGSLLYNVKPERLSETLETSLKNRRVKRQDHGIKSRPSTPFVFSKIEA